MDIDYASREFDGGDLVPTAAGGQVYFLAFRDIYWILALTGLTLLLLPWLYRVWLLSQLGADRGCRKPVGRLLESLDLGWRLLLVVLGSLTLGLPAWTAALYARNLKAFFILSLVFSLTAFLLAWVLALWGDQPFAPVLVLIALLQAVGCYLLKRLRVRVSRG